MTHRTVMRRLAAAATGVILTLAGALTLSTPAHAQTPSEVVFSDNCDDTRVNIRSGTTLSEYEWTVTAGGVTYFGEDDEQPGPGDSSTVVRVPDDAGTIVVDFAGSPAGWPMTHDWSEPAGFCDELADPVVTQPTCDDESGYIQIPAVPESIDPTDVRFFIGTDLEQFDDFEEIGPGETATVGPGLHTVSAHWSPMEGQLLRFWEIEIVAADCPPDEEDENEGAGGELPETGSSTSLLVVGALLLLVVGGGLLLVTRRRVRFTS